MFLKLRVTFTVLCALCLAAILPVAVWAGWFWLAVVGGAAFLFFALMLFFKQAQEREEEKNSPKEAPADYLSPKNSKK